MEPGPLPPHERVWRHPSELAAEEHALARAATAPATTRMFAITTGTVGLLAVGLLMLAVTPRGSDGPVAISATTTPAAPPADPTPTVAVAAVDTSAGTPPSGRAPIGIRGRPDALATPIGAGRFAVVTAADLAADVGGAVAGTPVEVAVPSGQMRDARIVGRVGDTVLIELEIAEPGPDLAEHRPAGHEIVTVLAEPPITVVLDDLAELDVEEGTAVLDDDGDLVGLCSDHLDQTRLVEISHELVGATDGR